MSDKRVRLHPRQRRDEYGRSHQGPFKQKSFTTTSTNENGLPHQQEQPAGVMNYVKGWFNQLWTSFGNSSTTPPNEGSDRQQSLNTRSDHPSSSNQVSHTSTPDEGSLIEGSETSSIHGTSTDRHHSNLNSRILHQHERSSNGTASDAQSLSRTSFQKPSSGKSAFVSDYKDAKDVGNIIMNKNTPSRQKMNEHSKLVRRSEVGSYTGFSDKIKVENSAFGARPPSKRSNIYGIEANKSKPTYVRSSEFPKKRIPTMSPQLSDDESSSEYQGMPPKKKKALLPLGGDEEYDHGPSAFMQPDYYAARPPSSQIHRPPYPSHHILDTDSYTTSIASIPSSTPAKRILSTLKKTNVPYNIYPDSNIIQSDDTPIIVPPSITPIAPAWATPARPHTHFNRHVYDVPSSDSATDMGAPSTTKKRKRPINIDLPPSTSLLDSAATWTQRKKRKPSNVALVPEVTSSSKKETLATRGLFSDESSELTSAPAAKRQKLAEPTPAQPHEASWIPSDKTTKPISAWNVAPKPQLIEDEGETHADEEATRQIAEKQIPKFSIQKPTTTTPLVSTSEPQKPKGMSDAEWEEVKPKPVSAATAAFMSGASKPLPSATTSTPIVNGIKSSPPQASLISSTAPPSTASTSTQDKAKDISTPPSSTAAPAASTTKLPSTPSTTTTISVTTEPKPAPTAAWVPPAVAKPPATIAPSTTSAATVSLDSTKPSDKNAPPPGWQPPKFGKAPTTTTIVHTPSTAKAGEPQKPEGMSDAEWEEVKPKPMNAATAAFLSAKPSSTAPTFGAPAKPVASIASSTTPSEPKKPEGMSDAEWEEVKPKAPNAATLAFMAKPAVPVSAAAPTPTQPKKPEGMSDAEWEEVKPKAPNAATLAFMAKPSAPSPITAPAASQTSETKDVSELKKPEGMSDAEWAEVKPKPISKATAQFISGAKSTPATSSTITTAPTSTTPASTTAALPAPATAPQIAPMAPKFGVSAPLGSASIQAKPSPTLTASSDDVPQAPSPSSQAALSVFNKPVAGFGGFKSSTSPSSIAAAAAQFSSFGKPKPSSDATVTVPTTSSAEASAPAKLPAFGTSQLFAPKAATSIEQKSTIQDAKPTTASTLAEDSKFHKPTSFATGAPAATSFGDTSANGTPSTDSTVKPKFQFAGNHAPAQKFNVSSPSTGPTTISTAPDTTASVTTGAVTKPTAKPGLGLFSSKPTEPASQTSGITATPTLTSSFKGFDKSGASTTSTQTSFPSSFGSYKAQESSGLPSTTAPAPALGKTAGFAFGKGSALTPTPFSSTSAAPASTVTPATGLPQPTWTVTTPASTDAKTAPLPAFSPKTSWPTTSSITATSTPSPAATTSSIASKPATGGLFGSTSFAPSTTAGTGFSNSAWAQSKPASTAGAASGTQSTGFAFSMNSAPTPGSSGVGLSPWKKMAEGMGSGGAAPSSPWSSVGTSQSSTGLGGGLFSSPASGFPSSFGSSGTSGFGAGSGAQSTGFPSSSGGFTSSGSSFTSAPVTTSFGSGSGGLPAADGLSRQPPPGRTLVKVRSKR